MNKKRETEYTGRNRPTKKRRYTDMDYNLVHDMEYTFADEYYSELSSDYYESLKKDLMESDE